MRSIGSFKSSPGFGRIKSAVKCLIKGRESSGSQFYIVQGKVFSDTDLNNMEENGTHIKFTPTQRNVYKTAGGTPHLDYAYTVFGEVVEGLGVLDRISSVTTDHMNRPLEDVKIFKVTVLK